jgi:hypothetical protein
MPTPVADRSPVGMVPPVGIGPVGPALGRVPGVERLEARRLMTTLTAGPGQTGTFFFTDDRSVPEEIIYSDVTFEAMATDGANIVDPINASPGFDLFKIYVTQSATDSYIAITSYDPTTGDLLPYTAANPPFSATNVDGTPYSVSLPSGTGRVRLGFISTGPVPFPLDQIPLTTSFGLQPAPESGILTAGIEVARVNPATGLVNNFGNFLVGGAVFGSVLFGGNVNEFYAGAVLTGNINGNPIVAETTAPLAPVVATTDTTADTTTASPPSFANFSVNGDIREFLTDGPVGSDGKGTAAAPLYVTGFAMTVGGTVGEVHVGNSGEGVAADADWVGTLTVSHTASIASGVAPTGSTYYNAGDFADQLEVEDIDPAYVGASWNEGELDLRNDATGGVALADGAEVTLPTDPQFLGSIPEISPTSGLPITDATGAIVYNALVDGNLQAAAGDTTDWYAMSFMAGKTFTVELDGATTLDIYDPDGRLIASNAEVAANDLSPIQVTTDRPGIYYFEVTGGASAYQLQVTNTGDMGLGAFVVDGYCDDAGYDSGLVVDAGDLGVVDVAGAYASLTTGPTPSSDPYVPIKAATSIGVNAGDLRAVYASALGVAGAALADGPTLNVPFGSVGLVRSTSGVLDLNSQFDPNDLNLPLANNVEQTPEHVTDDAYATAIGGSIQVIDAFTTFQADLAINGGIGTINCGNMATTTASYFDINADNKGNDGIIDLIDDAGDFGTFVGGGPVFVTNDGGDVRYVTVGGACYRDLVFGNADDDPVTGAAGAAVSFTDQAGNLVTVTPEGPTTTTPTTTTSASGVVTTTNVTTGPQITMLLYPVRDKSGDIPISLTSTQGMLISAAGTAGNDAEVDIGQVTVAGVGRAVVATGATDAYGNPTIAQDDATGALLGVTTTGTGSTAPTGSITGTLDGNVADIDATDTFLLLQGPATVNVLSVVSTGNAVAVQNATRGEIVSLTSPEIGTIQTVGNLGYATPEATPAAILPRAVIANGNAYPFVQQHTGVVIGAGVPFNAAVPGDVAGTGNAVQILVGGAAANIEVGGTLQTLVANYGQHAPPGQLDGITGPVVATSILNVNIGQGITFHGTGSVGESGLFAVDTIGVVANTGNPGANIMGPIIAGDDAVTTGQSIGYVQLVNGSLIDTYVATLANADFPQLSDQNDTTKVYVGLNQIPSTVPYVYDIGAVSVSGAGGIIGSVIGALNVGPVIVANGGFGILDSEVESVIGGRVDEVIASGYGIRDSSIEGGGDIGPVTASGSGANLPVTNFPLSVRPGDNGAETIDPATGMYPTAATDIDAILGVTGAAGSESDVTDTGVIEDDLIETNENFAGLTAHAVRTALPLSTINDNTTPSELNIPVYGQQFVDSIDVGGVLGLIRVYSTIDGLQVVAGQLQKVQISNNISRLGISVAGQINSFIVHGNLGQTINDPATGDPIPDSYVKANGPAGTLTNFVVYGSLFANVTATGKIGTMTITGNIAGSIDAQGNVVGTNAGQANAYSVNKLTVGGSIEQGSLDITGRVNQLIVDGGLGAAGGSLTIAGGANTISVGANRRQTGSKLALALTVDGSLNRLNVFGEITGSVDVLGNLTALNVTGDGTSPDAVDGPITVGGRLYNATITNGNVDADVTVDGDLYNLTVVRGSITAASTIDDTLASIHNIRVIGGPTFGIAGSVLAPSGTNLGLSVSGNLGNGTTPSTVSALSGNSIVVDGSILADTTVTFAGPVNNLLVDGNVDAGATIDGYPIRHRRIRGNTAGTING